MVRKKTNEERFKKLTPIEHILQRSSMYIGNIHTEPTDIFVFEDINNIEKYNLVYKKIDYNAGFCKLYDELLVNSSDHYIRTKKVKYIKISVNKECVTIENDGPGIPIEIHKTHKIFLPEMLLGNIHAGENFNDTEQRLVGGLNGLGASLTNIFSTKFMVETADGKKKYKQVFTNNMSKKTKPSIVKSSKNYTKITYYPDFEKFGLTEINDDIQSLFFKRAIDIAAYSPGVKVYYNNKLIPIKSFKDYIKMFLDDEQELFYEKINDNWEIGLVKSSTSNFQQISMVNGISTIVGGTHVNYITNQIVKSLLEKLERSNKKLNIKPTFIKNHLFMFLNCKIPNPMFETQTKENLTSRMVGEVIENVNVSDKFIKQVLQSDIIEDIINFIQLKEQSQLKKLNNGKTKKVKLKKLEDANFAGTTKSDKCLIFIAEGDSAMGSVMMGFSSVGRDYYGCYPLKGKPMNVRDIPLKKLINDNEKTGEEIRNLITALGLEFGKKYMNTNELRYGKVVIFADSDLDGTHIKGLMINLFETFWPELLELDFIYEFVSPIVKVNKGKIIKYFYKLNDYRKWKQSSPQGYFTTYFKGIGTLEKDEIKMFFSDIDKHLIKFNYDKKKETKEIIDLVFRKNRAGDRRNWMEVYKTGYEVDKFNKKTTYLSFFNEEFIEFSMADNVRSIPSVVDGFKPSQRKVMYTLFKKNYSTKIKVSQLTGSIIESSSYHHGATSLEGTIVNLAQDFVGSNNLSLLQPLGNFGTRLKGGKDSASSRYIFTKLNDITRNIYQKEDDSILNYLDDDGYLIEPEYYIPIIPMVLVNGSEGIGTGWSTDVPKYNIKDIIEYLTYKINDNPRKLKSLKLEPFYNKFKGDIIYDSENNRYISRGIINKISSGRLNIKELPVGMWNDKYYDVLDKLVEKDIIHDYKKNDTDEDVDITIMIDKNILTQLETEDILYKTFQLETYLSVTNMNLFDKNGKIKKYNDIYEIIEDYYEVRIEYYNKRKEFILNKLSNEIEILRNKSRFIDLYLNNKIKIGDVKKVDIEKSLDKLKFFKVEDTYNYLLNMSIMTLTNERIIDLKNTIDSKIKDYEVLEDTTIEKLWLNDLKDLTKNLG